jgi:hypothetical protein
MFLFFKSLKYANRTARRRKRPIDLSSVMQCDDHMLGSDVRMFDHLHEAYTLIDLDSSFP